MIVFYSMDSKQIKLFKARWRAINDFEEYEQHSTDPEKKLKQTTALFLMAIRLGWSKKDTADEISQVRWRWNTLKEKLLDR